MTNKETHYETQATLMRFMQEGIQQHGELILVQPTPTVPNASAKQSKPKHA